MHRFILRAEENGLRGIELSLENRRPNLSLPASRGNLSCYLEMGAGWQNHAEASTLRGELTDHIVGRGLLFRG